MAFPFSLPGKIKVKINYFIKKKFLIIALQKLHYHMI